MYTVTVFAKNKVHHISCSKEQAEFYRKVYWHLSPEVRDPQGSIVLANEGVVDDEF